MTFAKKMRLLLAIAIMVSAITVFFLGMLEISSSSYNSYNDAMSRHAIEDDSWLPTWLPESSFNIHESHDIDTNESWFVFSYKGSTNFNSSACRTIDKNKVLFPRDRGLFIVPKFVRDMNDQLKINMNLSFYVCTGKRKRYLAVDLSNKTVFGWALPH